MLLGQGNDTYFYFLMVGLALYFFTFAWKIPSHGIISLGSFDTDSNFDAEAEFDYGRLLNSLRSPIFFGLSSMFWFVTGVLTEGLDNCSNTFFQCYTNPFNNDTTSTLSQFSFGQGAFFIFMGMFFLSIFLTFLSVYSMMHIRAKQMDARVKRVSDTGPT